MTRSLLLPLSFSLSIAAGCNNLGDSSSTPTNASTEQGSGYTWGESDDDTGTDDSGTGDDTATEPVADGDGDGYAADVDCDDGNGAVHPDAAEACNGIDDDCDTMIDEDMPTWYADGDGDGYGDPESTASACDQPAGYVANGGDCDDWHAEQNPGVPEYCNGADDDCDGVIPADEIDADGDGYNGCTAAVDCDDTDAAIYPGASSPMLIGVDNNCDGQLWCAADLDEDGYADMNHGYGLWPYVESFDLVCGDDPGEAELTDPVTDCDDTDAAIYPGNGC